MTRNDSQAGTRAAHRPPVIGLTGGIGSGKSTVAGFFADLGITVVDADQLAHALAEPGEPGHAAIVAAFGDEALNADGALDRAWLRRRIFSNPEDKQTLEDILHPLIRARMTALLDAASGPYSIAVIPLLLETGQTDMVDRILLVDIPEDLQLTRVAARDGLEVSAIRDIMATQADRATRLAAADDVLVNEGDRDSLKTAVKRLHTQYLQLAQA